MDFFKAVGGLAILLLVVGFLAWIFERKRNPTQFGGTPWKGIGSGFWWSAVTMTTVGYGDKAPVSAAGRILALIWMFMGLIVISSFTAAIASAITVTQLSGGLDTPGDLKNVKSAVVSGSASVGYMSNKGYEYKEYETLQQAIDAVLNEQMQAVVHDAPLLRYLIRQQHDEALETLPFTFNKMYYGLALPADSERREAINISILEYINTPEWRLIVERYTGDGE